MSETMEQKQARWLRESEADQAAIALGLAYGTPQHGVYYWDGGGQQFRAGYEAGKAAQRAQAQEGQQQ